MYVKKPMYPQLGLAKITKWEWKKNRNYQCLCLVSANVPHQTGWRRWRAGWQFGLLWSFPWLSYWDKEPRKKKTQKQKSRQLKQWRRTSTTCILKVLHVTGWYERVMSGLPLVSHIHTSSDFILWYSSWSLQSSAYSPSCRSCDTWPLLSSSRLSGHSRSRGDGASPGQWCKKTRQLHSREPREEPPDRLGRSFQSTELTAPRRPAAPL